MDTKSTSKSENISDERRQHQRYARAYPITLFGQDGRVLTKANTSDLSHGGTYVTVDSDTIDDVREINVSFSIPASEETHQVEGFATNTKVIRLDPTDDGDKVGVALQFSQQMQLPIE
ncbi:MAG: PilZ domain-containing protein [bacterium]|nr:PilZ domain-containing protein [bacterium]